jgi:hypothetical protein
LDVTFNYCRLSEIEWSTLYKVMNGWRVDNRTLENGKGEMENEKGKWKMEIRKIPKEEGMENGREEMENGEGELRNEK